MSDRLTETKIKNTEETLPLLELFTQLREAGLTLGIDEYKLLLQALQQGFGTRDRLSLKRLCQAVWVKSVADRRLFDYYFDRIWEREEEEEDIRDRSQDGNRITETQKNNNIESPVSEKVPSSKNVPTEWTLNIDDEVEDDEVGKSALQNNSRFLLTREYFPVTERQMKQSWRYLRRATRERAPIELDVEATINKIGRQGMLLELVMVPRRVNRAELMLLIDRDGSMVPFHALSQRLAETALRGGRLGSADIYYFHDCPIEYLYRDRHHQEAEAISSILDGISERTAVLIFSDGGAARGGHSPDRVELTEIFLEQIKTKVRYIAWLNPMPKSRWEGTTAGEIARMVPMFAVSRSGLQSAINVLRGR